MSHDSNVPQFSTIELTKEDFVSDQMVKWCPGCGAHAILHSIEKVFPKLGKRKEDFTIVSGIGCSSRFPYYVNTYGIHGIHGRALAIASGVKISNPNLSVWVASGDGDSMAIGGNHFIHTIRRNIDLNVMMFNNQVYGLTKGQYSPTTPKGGVTKSSPHGTFERPFNPGELVLGAQGTFFARVVDTDPKQMTEIMFAAAKHKGTSIVEILQNCVIYADKTHALITSRETRDDYQVFVRDGKPMLFGKEKEKGLRLNGFNLEIVKLGENGITEADILVHNEKEQNPVIHLLLARMRPPEFPMAVGVIRAVICESYEEEMVNLIEYEKKRSPIKNVDDLLNSGNTWEI
ncbi:2-oxoacid:ferredoxin oxidoreductase subunit beta [candidate division KSB1 bacterium]